MLDFVGVVWVRLREKGRGFFFLGVKVELGIWVFKEWSVRGVLLNFLRVLGGSEEFSVSVFVWL